MITEEEDCVRIENGELGLDVETSRQFSLRGIHNKRSGRYYEIAEAAPAAILLSAARERIPISSWRMNLTSPARDTDHLHERGYLAGFHTLDVADEDWYEVEFPFGTSFRYQVRGTPNRYEGYGWFRRCVDLPADGAGETEPLVSAAPTATAQGGPAAGSGAAVGGATASASGCCVVA